MLILTRKTNEEIIIGDNITLRVLETHTGRVKIGIEAPSGVPIRRAEIFPVAANRQQGSAVALSVLVAR